MASSICLNCFKEKGTFDVCPHCGWVEGTPPEQAYHLHSGMNLKNRYIVGTVIGFGGFGVIYKAWDLQLADVVAIKEFFPSGLVNRVPGEKKALVFSGDKSDSYNQALDRFLEEARNIARFVNDPNIINVFNYFEENNTAYIVMECLEGISLSDYLIQQPDGKLGPDEALEIIKPVMDALITIHKAGIIHRDIHPGNIFLTTNKHIKIIDFGAAKFAIGEEEKTLTVVVTQGYASPEQYRSRSKQGPYTDIYGLGATLYKTITGALPEEAPDRQVDDQLKKPSELGIKLDTNLEKAIMKAMAVKPDLRFQSAVQFKEAVFGNRKVDLPEDEFKKRRVRRVVIASCIVLVVCLGIGASVLFNTIWKPTKTLDNLTISADTITMWVPVNDDSDTTSQKTAMYQSIEDNFNQDYDQINVDIVPVSEDQYQTQLAAAIADGTAPTLFDSSAGDGASSTDLSSSSASLDLMLRSVNMDDYLYLSNYNKLYPDKKEIPLGFQVLVLYCNDMVLQERKVAVPAEASSWDQLGGANVPLGVGQESMGDLLALYDSQLVNGKGVTVGSDTISRVSAINAGDLVDSSNTPMSLLQTDKIGLLVGGSSELRDVQAAIPGYYKVVPLSNGGIVAGRFTDVWSVWNKASENQQNAAMLFLSYLLNSYSQNVLYVQNDSNLPLNKDVFSEYLSINTEFRFLSDETSNVKFFNNGDKGLKQFGNDVYQQILVANLSDNQLRQYLQSYQPN